jgi:hypothetical protein
MKLIKMLGLAAVAAAALMAFVGASSASADVLCTVNNTPECPAGKKIEELKSSLKSGTKATLETTGGETLVTCTESSVSGKIEKQGEGVEPEGSFTKEQLTWGGCSSTTDTLAGGVLRVETKEVEPGVFKHTVIAGGGATGAKVTVNIFGVSCVYGPGASAISLGDLKQGEPALLEISTIVNKVEGGFLCPSSNRWTATYQITNHTALFVSKK